MLKLLFGVNNVGELASKLGKELESYSDETYLRRKGALKKLMEEVRVTPELARQQNKIVDKEGNVHFPDSFTLAPSYLPRAEAYSSLLVTGMPFNVLLAEILARILEGPTYRCLKELRQHEGPRACAQGKERSMTGSSGIW
jgi:hypothetical protein